MALKQKSFGLSTYTTARVTVTLLMPVCADGWAPTLAVVSPAVSCCWATLFCNSAIFLSSFFSAVIQCCSETAYWKEKEKNVDIVTAEATWITSFSTVNWYFGGVPAIVFETLSCSCVSFSCRASLSSAALASSSLCCCSPRGSSSFSATCRPGSWNTVLVNNFNAYSTVQ